MKQRSYAERQVCVISAKLDINPKELQCCEQHNISLAAAPYLLSQVSASQTCPPSEEDNFSFSHFCCANKLLQTPPYVSCLP